MLRKRIVLVLAAVALAVLGTTVYALNFLHVANDDDGDHLIDASDPVPNVYCAAAHADVPTGAPPLQDGLVNIGDIGAVVAQVGNEPPSDPRYDQNHNDAGDMMDIQYVVEQFGQVVATACVSLTPDPVAPSGLGATSGPEMALAAPGTVELQQGVATATVSTSGAGHDPYTGYWVTISFDPAVVQASAATSVGSLATVFTNCEGPFIDNGAGTIAFGCFALLSSSTDVGDLTDFDFEVIADGNPGFRLNCVGAPDDGGPLRGTYTVGLDLGQQTQIVGGCPSQPSCPGGGGGGLPSGGSAGGAGTIDASGSWGITLAGCAAGIQFADTCNLSIVQDEFDGLVQTGNCALFGKLNLTGTIDPITGEFSLFGTAGPENVDVAGTVSPDGNSSAGTWTSNTAGISGVFAAGRIVDAASASIPISTGGTVSTGTGDPVEVSLSIAANSITAPGGGGGQGGGGTVDVSIEVWDISAAPALQDFLPHVPDPDNTPLFVGVFNLGPDGATLDPPGQLTITYDQGAIDGTFEDAMMLIRFNGLEWENLPIIQRDTTGNSITALVDHFTLTGHKEPVVPDTDSDGCLDTREQQTASGSETIGGRRNDEFFWDYFDVPTGNPISRDQFVSGGDIAAVVGRFGSNDGTAGAFDRSSNPLSTPNLPVVPSGTRANYHPVYDRSGSDPNGNRWNLLPPDGAVSGGDIAGVVAQFQHNCT